MKKKANPFLDALNKRAAKGEIEQREFKREYLGDFSKVPKVGDQVKLQGKHPYSGHVGEIVRFETFMGKTSVVVRLFDMGDHEVGVLNSAEMKVI